MTDIPAPKPSIEEIALYQSGESQLAGASRVLKLSANENPYGPSPKAKVAFTETAATLHRYPSTDHGTLRRAIGEVHGLDPDRIACGVGSDEILALLCFAYAGRGREVIHTQHGFAMYRISALASGAKPVEVAETARQVDVDAILSAVTDATRLVFVANPANPTGTLLGADELTRLADGLPGRVVLVLDGAYAEFAEGYDGGASLAATRPNVVMTRTFSKLYGLGGLRVGWCFAAREIIDVINRVRGPFNLGGMQLSAAEAAVRDRDFAEHYMAENARLRARLRNDVLSMGLACDPSFTNFLLVRFPGAEAADTCDRHLRADGIIVRRAAGYGFPEALRITVGTEDDCAAVVESLRRFRSQAA
ncbi:MAG: histidinol-phosphate transaminase [Pseudomonadota bacterium]